MRVIKNNLIAVFALLVLAVSAAAAPPRSASQDDKVRKELVTLPYYGVFDNLEYQVNGDTVTLSGQVLRPSTRSDAARRVSRIEGVDHVINNIEVLPPSQFDDSIRVRAYRAIFRTGGLYRYAMGTNPSIHIIVKNGHVTLEGVVSNRMDSQLAYMAANGLPGVFSVTNNLRVQ
ncbi:MAG TPA: BON domain-containing protein [Blastocatellia bacterium]|nr:BON domain-containing protein [Blastocatellia bacterium]